MYSERATDVYTEKSLATVARFKCAALLPFTRLLFLFSDFICTQRVNLKLSRETGRKMVVGSFPALKLATLFVRQVSKPIAQFIANSAKNHPVLRTYFIIPPAQRK